MIQKVFTVFDVKSGAYMAPFFMHSKGQAIRAWTDTVNNPETQFARHPSDFTLFEIGEYDDTTGLFKNHEIKMPLGSALEFKSKPEGQAPLLDMMNRKAGK